MDCLFCAITKDLKNSKVVYEDDILAVILDINPICDGHLLIIPKEHYTTVFDVPKDTLHYMYQIAEKMIKLVNEKLGYDGASILFNYGDEQVIKHVHMHIIHHAHAKHEKTLEEVHKLLVG